MKTITIDINKLVDGAHDYPKLTKEEQQKLKAETTSAMLNILDQTTPNDKLK